MHLRFHKKYLSSKEDHFCRVSVLKNMQILKYIVLLSDWSCDSKTG